MQYLWCEDQWHTHLEDIAVRDARLEDTCDGVGLSTDTERLTDQLRIGTEMVPEFMRNDDDMVLSSWPSSSKKSRPRKKELPSVR